MTPELRTRLWASLQEYDRLNPLPQQTGEATPPVPHHPDRLPHEPRSTMSNPLTQDEVITLIRAEFAQAMMEMAVRLGLPADAVVSTKPAESKAEWLSASKAYIPLGLKSADALRDMVRSGDLRVGYEVRDVRRKGSSIARYQFHVGKCQERLNQKPEKRK